jgi:hypothetical protein
MTGQGNDFYVGYRRVPWGHSRFLRVFIPCALWAMAGLAGAMALSMRRPGIARWDLASVTELRGTLRERPYPMLLTPDESGAASVVLLAAVGKHGAQARVSGLDGRIVRLRGHMLTRDGRRMLEVGASIADVEIADGAVQAPAPVRIVPGERTRLRGEIVDAKCYMGAMKPGDGMGHRSCAALCVQGGIPPVLVVRDGEGVRHFLVTDREGGAANAWAAARMGETVEIEGLIVEVDGAPTIRADAGPPQPGYSQLPSP